MFLDFRFIEISQDLERDGLIWHPEIGDEVSLRQKPEKISILVDPLGMKPHDLRESFLWLPSLEQLVMQFEARQAFICHAGINDKLSYETVIKTSQGTLIETAASTLRVAFGEALEKLIAKKSAKPLH